MINEIQMYYIPCTCSLHHSITVSAPHLYLQLAGSKSLQKQKSVPSLAMQAEGLGPWALHRGFASRSYCNRKKMAEIVPRSPEAAVLLWEARMQESAEAWVLAACAPALWSP